MLCQCGMVMHPIYRTLENMDLWYLSCYENHNDAYLDLWWCEECGAVEEEQSAFLMTKDEIKLQHEFAKKG